MPRSHRPKAISGVVRVDFGQEPGAARIGREQFHHWREVGFWLAGLVALLVQTAIAISFLRISAVKSFMGLSFR